MKTRIACRSLVALAAGVVVALAASASANAAQILVFNSTRWVDSGQVGYLRGSQESDNLQAALAALGHTVTTIAGPYDSTGACDSGYFQPGTLLATAAEYSAALVNTHVFLIPEQESWCTLAAEMPADVAAVWRTWVANGGGLIIHSDYNGFAGPKVDDLFAVVFNFRIGFANGNGVTTSKKPAAAGTRFADGPPTLLGNDDTGNLPLVGLPPGSVSVYDNGTQASVVVIPFGAGKIIYLGWDWTLSNPPFSDGLNGGWYPKILDGAVHEAGERQLAVTRAGTGSGTVGSTPAGIDCGTTCTGYFATGSEVALTATAAAGSTFQGWSGDADCADGVVTLGGNRACTATFVAAGTPPPPPPPGNPSALLVTGPGPGGGPHVRIFRGLGETVGNAMADEPSFLGGVFVAVGNVDGAGDPEVVVADGPGGPPRVAVFRTDGSPYGVSFLAYPAAFTGGVRVAACDIDGDGRAEIVTAPGPGGGSHVRVWRIVLGGAVEMHSFFAYDPGVTRGLFVACGDVDGDGRAEVITSPDAGGGPHVRVWRVDAGGVSEVQGFFAYDPGFVGGVRVAAADFDGDGRADIVTGAGPGGGPHVAVWRLGAGAPVALRSFFAYDPGFRDGIFVAAGDLDGRPGAEIVTGADAGGGPHVRVFASDLRELTGFFAYDPGFRGGVHVAAGR